MCVYSKACPQASTMRRRRRESIQLNDLCGLQHQLFQHTMLSQHRKTEGSQLPSTVQQQHYNSNTESYMGDELAITRRTRNDTDAYNIAHARESLPSCITRAELPRERAI